MTALLAAAARAAGLRRRGPRQRGRGPLRSGDTIFASASGFGRAGVCVIRISGPQTRAILDRLAGGAPPPRRLSLRTLRDGAGGEALDQALVAWMPGPASFTGEDQAELHIHGGLAV